MVARVYYSILTLLQYLCGGKCILQYSGALSYSCHTFYETVIFLPLHFTSSYLCSIHPIVQYIFLLHITLMTKLQPLSSGRALCSVQLWILANESTEYDKHV